MKLAFYTGTRSGWRGIGNWLTRIRLRSRISHCELVFEPGDGVDDLMPRDGVTMLPTAQPNALGEFWCASSAAAEPLPAWSVRRAGRSGGVRFKRIDVNDTSKWILVDLPWMTPMDKRIAARWFRDHEGSLYDWQVVFGFLAWWLPEKGGRWTCHEACGAALDIPEPHRLDPVSLANAVGWRLQ